MPRKSLRILVCWTATLATSLVANAEETAVVEARPGVRWRLAPGEALQLTSPGGGYALTAGARLQLRYAYRADLEAQERAQDFAIRRARLDFKGNLLGRHNKYVVGLAFSRRDLGLEDGQIEHTPFLTWFLAFDYIRDAAVHVGQFKVPYSRQRLISSGRLQMVDRSIVNAEFNLDRDIGMQISSKDLFGLDLLRYAFFVGLGNGRDGYREAIDGLMYAGRIDVLPLGRFEDYSEADFVRGRNPRLSVGVSYAFVDNALDTHNLTADAMFKWSGLSMQAALLWRAGTRNGDGEVHDSGGPIAEQAPRNGIGAFGQAGYYWKRFELSARYAVIRAAPDSSLPDNNELGGAASYYLSKHAVKIQLDYFRCWGPAIGRGSDQLRLQLQLAI